jgi:hypothetical protein
MYCKNAFGGGGWKYVAWLRWKQNAVKWPCLVNTVVNRRILHLVDIPSVAEWLGSVKSKGEFCLLDLIAS